VQSPCLATTMLMTAICLLQSSCTPDSSSLSIKSVSYTN